MKRILAVILVLLMVFSLAGCASKKEGTKELDVISGVIVEKSHMYYTTSIVVQNNNGFKIPVYESHSNFTDGLKVGDKVSFEVEKVEGSGYKIIGVNI